MFGCCASIFHRGRSANGGQRHSNHSRSICPAAANNPMSNIDPLGLAWYDGVVALTGFGGQGTFSAAWGGFGEGWSKGGQGVVNDFSGGLFNSQNGLFYNSFDQQDKSAFGSGVKCDSAFKFGSNAGRVAEGALLAAGALQARELKVELPIMTHLIPLVIWVI